MKNSTVIQILFLLLFCLTERIEAAYDPDKITIVLDARSIVDQRSSPNVMKEGAVDIFRALVNSGKYNVSLYNNNFYGDLDFNTVSATLSAGLENPDDLLTVSGIQATNPNAFRSDDQYFYNRSDAYSSVELFAEIVRKEMDPDTEQSFADRGESIDLEGMEEAIFELGAIALSDGFSLGDINYGVDYSRSPPQCMISVGSNTYESSEELCIANMEMEYRWINQANRECALFVKGQENLFRNADALLCEPQHVQDFENYFQANILTSCLSAQDCLSGVSGQPLQELSRNFLAIMVETKVQELRSSAYADASFEFQAQFNQLLNEVASFNLVCEKLGIDAMVLGRLDAEETAAYEARINEINQAFAGELSTIMESAELDVLRDNGAFYYKKCILTQLEQGETNSSADGFFENCEREALGRTLSEVLRKQAIDRGGNLQEIEELVRNSLVSMCPFGSDEVDPIKSRQSIDLNSFDYRYDMNRCVAAISRIVGDYEAYAGLGNGALSDFNRTLRSSITDERVESLLRQNTQNCLENLQRRERNDPANIQQCYNEALVTTRAETLVESIILSAGNTASVRRDSSLITDVVNLSRGNQALSHCLNSEETTQAELVGCVGTIRTELAERLPWGLFSGHANSAAAALQADLELITKSLTREVSVFHWASDELTENSVDEPVSLTSWGAYTYAVGREYMFHVGPFLNSRVAEAGATMAGRGLYAASDPNSTTSYGETLFEIHVPEGSRFLDLREGRSDGGIPVSRDTFNKLIAEGCDLNSRESTGSNEYAPRRLVDIHRGDTGVYATISKTLFEQNGPCHDIFSEAISNLDVNFLAYSYGSSPASFCDSNRGNESAAFVMINNRMRGNVRNYNRAQISEAIRRSEEDGVELPEDIRRILQLNTDLYQTNDPEYREQTDSEAIEYWKSRLFNCDQSFEEDRVDSGLR